MSNEIKKTSIGGQALIEGVMMKGPNEIGICVRKSDGELVKTKKKVSIANKSVWRKIPVVRGCIAFFESMVTGVKSLMYSADFMDLEEEAEPSKFEKYLEEKLGDKLKDVLIYISVILSILLSVGMFMLLPNWITSIFKIWIKSSLILNAIEGIVRICIFLIYLALCAKMPDIKRVFQYHGAEHKSIACYEAGEELTVENARKHSRFHPRCGTSFLFIVMIISIICFSVLSWDTNIFVRSLSRIALMPVVAGVSYEILKFTGRHDNKCTKILRAPGMWFQKITTNEPDDNQLEVALESLKLVLTDDPAEDEW